MVVVDEFGQPIVVEDLDDEWLLDVLTTAEARIWAGERDKLRLAGQWAVLHPATADTGVATWEGPGLPGVLDEDESLGGEGCPAVSAFAPEPLAARLGVATTTGMRLIANALDLQHRLPRIWRLVEALEVAPWKACKVAELTHALSRQAAGYVDEQLAGRLASCGFVRIQTVVAQAIAKFHPELLAQREKQGKADWHVTLKHPRPDEFAGTSWLDVAGDTMDLTAFHDLVCQQADRLKALGDTDDLEVRKAKALGVIASQQAQLDLTTLAGAGPAGSPAAATKAGRRRPATMFYLHGSLTEVLDLIDGSRDGEDPAVGAVEKLGPATLEKLREWLGRSDVTIQPVIDLAARWAVDQHDPPAPMREQVILRDQHCAFPWCQNGARACDLDHIQPYIPMDQGGPPGQTNPENLAPLCRRHHRCKTSGRWRYRRRPDGSYEWHGPHGRTYLVTPTGTLAITAN